MKNLFCPTAAALGVAIYSLYPSMAQAQYEY